MTTPSREITDVLDDVSERFREIVKERNQFRLALEIIRDSFWSEGEPFEERVEYLQQTAKDILEAVRQRSTSE